MPSSLEAKIVVLGAQGVGKTSLVNRYCKGSFNPAQTTSTVGASFLTKRVVDTDTDTVVRLQIWDTAGQERFRSISRLYYRGANACILCYSITDAQSFADMGVWLAELRRNLPGDVVLHVVGTKADIVARDSNRREVPFERCIAYVAENLAPGQGSTPPPSAAAAAGPFAPPLLGESAVSRQPSGLAQSIASHSLYALQGGGGGGAAAAAAGGGTPDVSTPAMGLPPTTAVASPFPMLSAGGGGGGGGGGAQGADQPLSPSSKRSSGFWGQEAGWDACHEISAESGEGVEEVFRVVTRKLVEQNRKMQQALLTATAVPGTPGYEAGMDGGYFEGANPRSSFRVGRDRRSWLFASSFAPSVGVTENGRSGDDGHAHHHHQHQHQQMVDGKRRKCC